MTDHDPLDDLDDPQLAAALGALAPEADGDPYPAAHRRFEQRRRRHRIATVGAGVATAAAAVVLIAALGSGSSGISGVRTVDPAGRRGGGDRTTTSTGPAVPSPVDDTTTSTTAGPPTLTAPTTPTTSATSTPPPGTATLREETVDSEGGSIRVRIAGTTVQLLSTAPGPGYTADVRASGPTEVEVRFRAGESGEDEHEIRLRFDSDGTLRREID